MRVARVWKATKLELPWRVVFFFLEFMCFFKKILFDVFFVSGDLSESPNSGQHGAIRAMEWNPPNHIEMQKALIGDCVSAVCCIQESAPVSLPNYMSCNLEEATPN